MVTRIEREGGGYRSAAPEVVATYTAVDDETFVDVAERWMAAKIAFRAACSDVAQ